MTKNPHIALINFDEPDEAVVMRAIFHEAASNEPRGFSDAFTSEQILHMGASQHVLEHWSEHNRSWLWQCAASQEPS